LTDPTRTHGALDAYAIDSAIDWIAARLRGKRTVILTGAGCSTESGIPDYRGPETARRARNPIQYRGFVSDPQARARYWSRSFVGWPKIRDAAPNAGHHALAALEASGHVQTVITQNVDRLHHKAGSRHIIELHGTLAEVTCLACGTREEREALQRRMLVHRGLSEELALADLEAAPDGDADLADGAGAGFDVPACKACGGTLKPHVVFFGESVPADRVAAAVDAVRTADTLLVVGTSLAVYSGLRFVRLARELGLATALINLGPPARGLEYFDVVVDAHAGPTLRSLSDHIQMFPAIAPGDRTR
jgi:NAD-dependent SIR2 family protein deacetylase